jgi:RNA polymerase sigma-70 factor (ECF subfamily)
MDEGILLGRAAAGDAAAFGLLVRQYQSQLRGFLRRLARGDHALADDLSQETFLEAWKKIAQYRGEGSFAGWLLRIGWSRYLMTARQRKLEPLDTQIEIAEAAGDPNARLDLENAMAILSAGERAALTICYALGHSNEEGAKILDMPLGTLKSHIARGREKLRRMLTP